MSHRERIERLLASDKMLINPERLESWVERAGNSDVRAASLLPVVIQLQDVDAIRTCLSGVASDSDDDSIVQRLTIDEQAFPVPYAWGSISISELEWLLEQEFVFSVEEDDAYFLERGSPS